MSGFKRFEYHSETQVGYLATGRPYRTQGSFGGDLNLAKFDHGVIYGLANVDIDAFGRGASDSFQPDRLRGTFEVGYRMPIGKDSLTLFGRHQSSHNIDQTTHIDDSWDMIGPRFDWYTPGSRVSLSAGYYGHKHACNYATDADLQWFKDCGTLFSRPVQLHTDLHYVGEHNGKISSFVDYAVTPSIKVTDTLSFYVTYCQVHDMVEPDGTVEIPFIVGAVIRN